jgi:hypothetical protein
MYGGSVGKITNLFGFEAMVRSLPPQQKLHVIPASAFVFSTCAKRLLLSQLRLMIISDDRFDVFWQVLLEHNGEEIAVDKNRLNADALVVEQVVTVAVVMVMVMFTAIVTVTLMMMHFGRRGAPCAWLSLIKRKSNGKTKQQQQHPVLLLLQCHQQQQHAARTSKQLLLRRRRLCLNARARHLRPRTNGPQQHALLQRIFCHVSFAKRHTSL